ncbi:acyltransferase family protein [Caenimonas sedimenti]|uniref:acyltransferase family protein n=1 Tax=Caenimonas sedimenti TaxID=2596921 RepID=UPI001644DFC2|nr:acyltransferase [Caenimonas sedimenti]
MTGTGPAWPGGDKYPVIDILRGAAALTVVVYHVIAMTGWPGFPTSHGRLVFSYGWVGVNLFLVISGFVIGLTALNGYARNGSGFRAPYVRRRLARILPLYLLTGVVYVLLVESSLLQGPISNLVKQVAVHLLFVHNFSESTFGTINGPNWSVALEMQFYLLVLFITPWLARAPAWTTLVSGLAAAMLFRWASTLVLVPGVAPTMQQHVVSVWLPGVLDHFALGIFLAKAVRGEAGSRLQACLRTGWRPFVAWALVAAVLLRLAGWVLVDRPYWDNPLMIVGFPTLLAAGLSALVAAAITFPHPRSLLHRPLRYLGEISYGIYLWHVPVILSVIQRKLDWREDRLLTFVLVATVLLAAATWHLVEKPALDALQKDKA